MCSENGQCSNSEIYCPTSICNIICRCQYSCYSVMIYATHTQNVNIDCIDGDYVCYNNKIYAEKSDGLVFSTLNAISAGSVSISCISETTTVSDEGFCGEGTGACGCNN
eukprot:395933_1